MKWPSKDFLAKVDYNTFINFRPALEDVKVAQNFAAATLFLAQIRLLFYMAYVPHFRMLLDTLRIASKHLVSNVLSDYTKLSMCPIN